MLHDMLLLAVILNPFAQMVYLSDLINQTDPAEFRSIFLRATGMTLAILCLCAWSGEFLLFDVFQVTLPTMRIFGGMVNLSLAYSYVMHGPEGIKLFRGDVTHLAQQITLPVLVGAGVVWVSMKIGNEYPFWIAPLMIGAVLAGNLLLMLGYQRFYKNATGQLELMVIKYFGMAMRFNAMLIGAVGVEMILGGIREYLLHPPPL